MGSSGFGARGFGLHNADPSQLGFAAGNASAFGAAPALAPAAGVSSTAFGGGQAGPVSFGGPPSGPSWASTGFQTQPAFGGAAFTSFRS
jgi:hypothetical protein